MKRITLLATILSTLIYSIGEAQVDYKQSVGIRLGGDANGLTYKYQKNSTTGIEGILHSASFGRGFGLTGLYEKNQTAFGRKEFQFYYGAGAHIGFYRSGFYKSRYNNTLYYYNSTSTQLGIDGIIGLQYHIPTIPFAISLDIKPTIEFFSPIYSFIDGGFSIRYTF